MPTTPESNLQTSQITIKPISEDPLATYHLIFFITGNPGLIGYYNTFLTTLHDLLSAPSSSPNIIHIHGQSFAGFENESFQTQSAELRTTPYSLEDHISRTLSALESQNIPSGPFKGKPYSSTILIGHSVGAYILLELIRRLRTSLSPVKIRAGILLFPTVTHIAQSPSGVKISTLFRIPDFPRRANLVAKALLWFTPETVLKWLVGLVTRMPVDAAEVTTRFLRSRMGIWQALHMAKDEMETITEDKWNEDIWGIEHEETNNKPNIPKLIFYFGKNDHWVADHTRDALIAARGRGEDEATTSKPIMMIDENGVDHGFCIKHSESIAEKVRGWVIDIMVETSAS